MMLTRFLKSMFFITILALIYIHMQTNIYALAYQGKIRQKKIIEIAERNSLVSSHISKLKSTHYLAGNLLKDDSPLQFRGKDNVIQLVTERRLDQEAQTDAEQRAEKGNVLLHFLPLRAEAEARSDEAKQKPVLFDRTQVATGLSRFYKF